MISWATSPCEIQHKQREPKTWDFFLRVQVPAVICVPVCISMALFKIAERIKTLSPLVGNSWQGTKHQVPFQVMPLTCPKTFTDVLCPAKLICSQILSAEAIQALGQGPPRPPPPPSSVQCLGLHSSITMQALINSPSRLPATVAKPGSLPSTESFALLSFFKPLSSSFIAMY